MVKSIDCRYELSVKGFGRSNTGLDGFCFQFLRGLRHDLQRFRDLEAFFWRKLSSQLIHPTVARFDALLDELLTLIGEVQELGTAVIGVFFALDESSLHEFFHQLAGSRVCNVKVLTDITNGAVTAVMHLHQDTELRH